MNSSNEPSANQASIFGGLAVAGLVLVAVIFGYQAYLYVKQPAQKPVPAKYEPKTQDRCAVYRCGK